MNRIKDLIIALGASTIEYLFNFFSNLGKSLWLLIEFFKHPDFKKNFSTILQQIYLLGTKGLPIIILAALFIGAIIAVQGWQITSRFNSESIIGSMVALGVIRDLGPVMSGLLFAGRSASSITAEIALMKSNQQLESLDMMAINSVQRVIGPRFWASLISLPILNYVFIACAILASVMVAHWKQLDMGSFYSYIDSLIQTQDIINSGIKSLLFAFTVSWIAVYRGYYAQPTPAGISKATTNTVVQSSVMILLLDLLLTLYIYGG